MGGRLCAFSIGWIVSCKFKCKEKSATIINKQNTYRGEQNKIYIIESKKLRSRKGNLDGTYPFSYSLAVIPSAVENKIASRIDRIPGGNQAIHM